MIDIVLFYADLGRPYFELIQRMTESAKRVIGNECRTILLTPTPDRALCRLFDETHHSTLPATDKTICLERARAMAGWAQQTNRNTAFVDPDIEFRAAPPFRNLFDIALLWRKKMDQPINTGVILTRPGQQSFWDHYGQIVANLPGGLHAWYGDQLAFSLLTGVCRHADDHVLIDGSRVWLMKANDHCYRPDMVTEKAWAVHYKGESKGAEWAKHYEPKVIQGVTIKARI